MTNRTYTLLIALVVVLFIGCAPSRQVRTLEKGETAVSGSFGGPLINLFGITMPIPYTTVAVAHGVRDDITVFGGLHTTSLMFSTIQTDLGMTWRWFAPDTAKRYIPGFSSNFVMNSLVDLKEGATDFYPEVDLNAYWEYSSKKKHYIYFGVDNWFDLKYKRAHDVPKTNHWIFNPHIGHTWETTNWNYNLEFKYLAPNQSNQKLVVDYAQWFGKKGAPGLYFSISRRF